MVSNYRVPPPFEEGKPYESWKNEVGMWIRVTDLEGKKTGPRCGFGALRQGTGDGDGNSGR